MEQIYDLVIVGAGPAGLTAALYAGRKGLKSLILSVDLGGQIAKSPTIENFPGFEEISGVELIEKMLAQAKKYGAELAFEEVNSISKQNKLFAITTNKAKYFSKAVILAFGKTPRTLDAKGEKEFLGKGVSYCATCDMPLFKNKIVAVVGGGNSALEAALYGASIAKKVYLIHRRAEFRADSTTVQKAKSTKNIELVLNSVIKEIKGDKFVKSILVEDVNTKKLAELAVDGVFVEIGFDTKTDFLKDLVKLDESGQIIIDNSCATSCEGIFAAGDVTNTPFKQAVVAAGEGCKAALSAYNWLKGIKGVAAEWGKPS